MKTMLILISLFTFLNLNAQVPAFWDDIVNTSIPYLNSAPERIAIFANHSGVHVLKVLYSDYGSNNKHVKYFRLNSEGVLQSQYNFQNEYGDFPNIVGDENIIYAVYRKDNTIQVKYSTNGGNSWAARDPINFVNGNVNCNGVDAAYTLERGLHVVWSEKVGSNYESYFKKYDEDGWGTTQPFTNVAPVDYGGFPTVTTSYYDGQYKAHVTINTGNSDLVGDNHGRNYSRDYNYSLWSNPIAILPQDQQSHMDRLLFTEDGNIHSFYYKYTGGLPSYNYRKKLVTSSTWDSEKQIEPSVIYENMHKIQIAKTIGNTGTDSVHAFWIDNSPGFWQRKKNSSDLEWTIPRFLVSTYSVSFNDAAVVSSSNDLFALWCFRGAATIYHFRHYDDIPLVPQNLAVEIYTIENENHPKLTWTLNNEPDVYIKTDSYNIWRRISIRSGPWSTWSSIGYADGDETEYIDYTIGSCYPEANTAEYKIKAIDYNNHSSDFTKAVSINFSQFYKLSQNGEKYNYQLSQNYPNPFNPTTQIDYSIEAAGLVTLKVYDMLGTEVSSLVNEMKEAGSYSVTFNAANLPSGFYVYRLLTGNFIYTKKLILLK
jgi:hypothetical protein